MLGEAVVNDIGNRQPTMTNVTCHPRKLPGVTVFVSRRSTLSTQMRRHRLVPHEGQGDGIRRLDYIRHVQPRRLAFTSHAVEA